MLVSRQVSRSFSVTLVNGFLGFFVLKTQYEKIDTSIQLNVRMRVSILTS